MNRIDEINEILKKYFFYIAKYPEIINLVRENIFIDKLIPVSSASTEKKIQNTDIFEEKYFYYLDTIVKTFEKIENTLMDEEKRMKHQVPIFNYNADLIIGHSRKISNPDHRLIYLNLVLEYYQNHLPIRYQELMLQMELLGREFKEQSLQLISSAINYLSEELDVENLPFPKSMQTFEEQITLEMRTTIHLNEKKNENILEAINNPPGTKKRKEELIESDNSEENTKSEYMTSKEVQDLLKISYTTVYNYMKSGKLTPNKIARKNYFKRKEVISLIEGK